MNELINFFDVDFYQLKNPDLLISRDSLWSHFEADGFREGREFVDLSRTDLRNFVMASEGHNPRHLSYIRIVAAEIYLTQGNADLSLAIARDLRSVAGSRAISLELRSLVAQQNLSEAVTKAKSFYENGVLNFAWYSDHGAVIRAISNKLVLKGEYEIAWSLSSQIRECFNDSLIRRELEYLSRCKLSEDYFEADEILSRTIAYQAEVRTDVENAIMGYSRAVALGHPEKEWLSGHIDDLIVYRTVRLLEDNRVIEAFDYMKFRLNKIEFRAKASRDLASFVIVIAETAFIDSNVQLSKEAIELSNDLELPCIALLSANLLDILLKISSAESVGTQRKSKFYSEAKVKISNLLRDHEGLTKSDVERHLLAFAYRCEVQGLLVLALDLCRLANLLSSDVDDVLLSRIARIGRSVVQSLIEEGHESVALDYAQDLTSENAINKTRLYKLANTIEFAQSNDLIFHISRQPRTIEAPTLRFLSQAPQLTAVRGDLTAPATYYATVTNCLAFSRSNIIICGDYALYDLAADPRGITARLGDVNTCDLQMLTLGSNRQNILVEYPSGGITDLGDGFAMFGVQSQNYGHWLLEFLPRMLEFAGVSEFPDAPIYVDPGLPSTIIESLRLLNTGGRPILELPNNGACWFKNLVVSSPPNFFPLDFRAGSPVIDTVWPTDVFSEFKAKVIEAIDNQNPSQTRTKRRIYISRGAYPSRSLVNAEIIKEYLLGIGFEIIVPENLTFSQQVRVFQSASVVVGSCSSALSNAIFCDAGTPIVALIHDYPAFNFNGYASFIQAGGAEVTFVQGKGLAPDGVHPFHADFTIRLSDLVSALSNIMREAFANAVPASSSDFEARAAFLSPLIDANYIKSRLKSGDHINDDLSKAYILGQLPVSAKPNLLFDEEFYASQINFDLNGIFTPLEHYMRFGAYEGLKPSDLFDSSFYLRTNKDVADSGENPLAHFLRVGCVEGRLPFGESSSRKHYAVNIALEEDPTDSTLIAIKYLLDIVRGDMATLADEIRSEDFPFARGLFFHGCLQLETEGRFSEALIAFQILSRMLPDDAIVHFKIGALLRRLGRLKLASKRFEQAFTGAPGVPFVSEALTGLTEHITKAEANLQDAFGYQGGRNHTAALRLALSSNAAFWNGSEITHKSLFLPIESSPSILLFDTSFPDRVSSFRFGEFSNYLENISDCSIVSSIWDLKYFGGDSDFAESTLNYCDNSGVSPSRVKSFDYRRMIKPKLTYSVFLNNAAVVASDMFYETETFAFTLYPGGGFNVNNKSSNALLRRICEDRRLKGIITTQRLTYDYLVENKYCDPALILHKFGGIVPSCLNAVPLHESRVLNDHSGALKVCFVAQRYSAKGVEKGYDVFIKVASQFRGRKDVEFHVVGGFDETVIELPMGANILFHGIKKSDFFPEFYSRMDVILSPALSNLEIDGHQGSFDGFPTTTCVEAGVLGVAMFLVDTLGLNRNLDGSEILKSGVEFELVVRDPEQISALLERYLRNRPAVAELGLRGRDALLRLFSIDAQIKARVDFLKHISVNS